MDLLAESTKKNYRHLRTKIWSDFYRHRACFISETQLYCLNSHFKECQAPANYNIKTDTHLNAQKIGRVTPSFWVAVKTRRRGTTLETSGFPPFSKLILILKTLTFTPNFWLSVLVTSENGTRKPSRHQLNRHQRASTHHQRITLEYST